MKRTKLISKVLYVITSTLSLGYLITALYGAICCMVKINVQFIDDRAIIEFPFTEASFLILDNNLRYILFGFLLPMLSYAIFFWLLASVFKVFYQQKLFTEFNIVRLKRFYLANIFAPIPLMALSSFFIDIDKGMFMIITLHLFLGTFIFILSEIFNQGLTLQNEQDLYI